MKSQPLVSILINNYNYGRFLKTAIESALNQTYQPIEVIVVDDGSTDQSREIISSYGDRIVPILKENGGQASAFNSGFLRSHGEIICFLDSDDLFKSEKVATVVKDFQKNPAVGWHFHTLEFFGDNPNNNVWEEQPDLSGVYDLAPFIIQGKLKGSLPFEVDTATSGTCFRRLFLEKILPMPEVCGVTLSDDYIKYVSLGLSPGYIRMETMAMQRLHGENVSTFRSDKKKLKAQITILTAYWIKNKFPELSKFSNNLLSLGISIYWWLDKEEFDNQEVVEKYLSNLGILEKVWIYAKAWCYRYLYYRFKR